MIINIIAYRPDGADYSMSCLMGTSSSNLETFHTEDVSKAAEFIAKKKFEDHFADREYRNHEFVIILDGHVVRNDIDNTWSPENETDAEAYEYHTVIDGMHNSIDTIVEYLLKEKENNDIKAKAAEEQMKRIKAIEEQEKHARYIYDEYMKLVGPK